MEKVHLLKMDHRTKYKTVEFVEENIWVFFPRGNLCLNLMMNL